jgi:WD40 repeat protein
MCSLLSFTVPLCVLCVFMLVLVVLCCVCCCRVLRGHTGWINDVVLSRSGNQAVTISGDGTSRVWETKTNKCLHVSRTHTHRDDIRGR